MSPTLWSVSMGLVSDSLFSPVICSCAKISLVLAEFLQRIFLSKFKLWHRLWYLCPDRIKNWLGYIPRNAILLKIKLEISNRKLHIAENRLYGILSNNMTCSILVTRKTQLILRSHHVLFDKLNSYTKTNKSKLTFQYSQIVILSHSLLTCSRIRCE